ncbi:Exonuclease 1 [Forsythia ovata]|uniref:Exonuclease 1 n=1 Tax=Forsythia ovata TaxID=205694 RepID=A0ABD1XCW0_9LAMI
MMSRRENLSRAMEHESNGNLNAAYKCYQKAVDTSPSVAHDLIQGLKQQNVSYIVAPYEADAQMTFLAVSKQIIYKMDKFGQGVEFRYSKLQHNKELNLTENVVMLKRYLVELTNSKISSLRVKGKSLICLHRKIS